MDLLAYEYGWTLDQVLDCTLSQVLLMRRSIFKRRMQEHARQARLLEAVTKNVVASVHGAAGSKYGQRAADQIDFLKTKKVVVASSEKVTAAFGSEPLFSEEKMREIRRGRRGGKRDLPGPG